VEWERATRSDIGPSSCIAPMSVTFPPRRMCELIHNPRSFQCALQPFRAELVLLSQALLSRDMTSTDLQRGCAVFDPWASNAAPWAYRTRTAESVRKLSI
jgi:hypothetical protein